MNKTHFQSWRALGGITVKANPNKIQDEIQVVVAMVLKL